MSEPIKIRQATPEDFPEIAALIVEQTQHAERRCIHSDPRGGGSEALDELEHLHSIGELVFVLANRQDRLVGCAGAEFDMELRRAWLRGPFVEAEEEVEWAEAAGRLVEALEQGLPEEITILDSFLDLAHEWGDRLMGEKGYRRVRLVHVYQAEAGASSSPGPAGGGITYVCIEMQPEHARAVAALHEQLFPNTYLTAEQIVAAGEAGHQTLVYVEDGRVLGYVYGSENLGEGVVDFIGVDPDAWRRGIGRALLSAILRWIFIERGLEKASLTVHDELVNAQALYEQAGFRLLYTGVHHRKER